ncbi:hypothetical protein ACLBYG_22260 [Methylobacterium sp. D53M]
MTQSQRAALLDMLRAVEACTASLTPDLILRVGSLRARVMGGTDEHFDILRDALRDAGIKV